MFQPSHQILLSGALSFGVPLALAVRELLLLPRAKGVPPRAGDAPDPLPVPFGPDDDASLPPLPACLAEAARDRSAATPDSRRHLEHA